MILLLKILIQMVQYLCKDINNQLYAGSVDNSIFIDGQKVNTNFIAGWEILGVETYIDNSSQASTISCVFKIKLINHSILL